MRRRRRAAAWRRTRSVRKYFSHCTRTRSLKCLCWENKILVASLYTSTYTGIVLYNARPPPAVVVAVAHNIILFTHSLLSMSYTTTTAVLCMICNVPWWNNLIISIWECAQRAQRDSLWISYKRLRTDRQNNSVFSFAYGVYLTNKHKPTL